MCEMSKVLDALVLKLAFSRQALLLPVWKISLVTIVITGARTIHWNLGTTYMHCKMKVHQCRL